MTRNALVREIKRMDADAQILLIEDVWDNLSDKGKTLPVPVHHKKELLHRWSSYLNGKTKGISMEEFDRQCKALKR